MRQPRVLIVFASSYGQTQKISEFIAEHLRNSGMGVRLVDANQMEARINPGEWDMIVVGASIIARGHQPSIRAFIQKNAESLASIPSAFFSVCASAGSTHAKSRVAAVKLRVDFLAELQWMPECSDSFAGAINFTKYGWLLRQYMRFASKLNGGSTDTSRDHEYTDWHQVTAFADRVAALAESEVTAIA